MSFRVSMYCEDLVGGSGFYRSEIAPVISYDVGEMYGNSLKLYVHLPWFSDMVSAV